MTSNLNLIPGAELTVAQRRQVLSAFVHRNTIEHPFGWGCNGHAFNQPSTVTDAAWVAEHAFYFVKDGSRLNGSRKHCEPAYLAREVQA